MQLKWWKGWENPALCGALYLRHIHHRNTICNLIHLLKKDDNDTTGLLWYFKHTTAFEGFLRFYDFGNNVSTWWPHTNFCTANVSKQTKCSHSCKLYISSSKHLLSHGVSLAAVRFVFFSQVSSACRRCTPTLFDCCCIWARFFLKAGNGLHRLVSPA